MSLIYELGSVLSIDEMMIRFCGKSNETHRIKGKPIREGYKFFVLATKQGYIVNFTPDGRSAAKDVDKMDYDSTNNYLGKIGALVLHLCDAIILLKEKQIKRIKNKSNQRITRNRSSSNKSIVSESRSPDDFVIAMDNYFTRPKAIYELRKLNIGIVGTAQYQRAWPPEALKKVDDKKCDFNDFFWTVDDYGTLVARWMDNGMVFCTSTIHRPGKSVERCRRKPRKTKKNEKHVDKIWGKEGRKNIKIPTLIDDYNHWMGGVDLSDQRIAYYHPNLRCRRNWIPLFIQLLSIIRSNAFIVHQNYFKNKSLTHKNFTFALIDALIQKSMTKENISARNTPESGSSYHTPPLKRNLSEVLDKKEWNDIKTDNTFRKQRMRLSKHIGLDSFPLRKELPRALHRRVKGNVASRSSCVYCAWLYSQNKNDGDKNWTKTVKRTNQMCYYCNEYLCKEHFDIFHDDPGTIRKK